MGIRLSRLQTASGSILMVPMDHGISMGPVAGLSPPGPTLEQVAEHATCATAHKGMVRHLEPFADRLGILMHLSASTDLAPDGNDKRIVGSVEEALRRGCDGVSTHLNLGAPTEADMVAAVGAVSDACHAWGMPHIAMVYPRGPAIDDPFDPDLVAHAARLGAELGADAVKVPYTGSPETFAPVVQGAGIPVIVAGGPRVPDLDRFVDGLRGAAAAGAAGVSIGRNVFQADQPSQAIQAIASLFP